MRNVLGGLLALIGAAATLVSPWHAWYNNRHGSSYKFYEVFGSGVTASRSGIMDSVFLLFLVTAVLAVAGVLLRSRTLVGVAGVVALGFTILWMVRQGQAAGELTVTGSNNRGLGSGVAYAFGGSLLMIIGSLMMTGRPRPVVVAESTETTRAAGVAGVAGTRTADQSARTGSTAAAPPAITTTAPVDKNRPAPPPTAAASGQTASDRTGTERLSKEEREMLGLDEDAKTPPKNQN
jgi:hypothetical protein